MDRDRKSLGIVIKSDNIRTSDRLVSILTPDSGIIKAYSYGSRKSAKSLKAPVYTEGVFSLYQKGENGAISIKDIDILSTHDYIYQDFDKLTLASFLSELVIKSQNPDGYFYKLFTSSIDALETYSRDIVGSVFLVKYLQLLGLSGNWRNCPICGREYSADETLGFSISDNVAVCSDDDSSNHSIILPKNARLFIRRVYELDENDCYSLRVGQEQLGRIFRYLVRTISLIFPSGLKSLSSGLLI